MKSTITVQGFDLEWNKKFDWLDPIIQDTDYICYLIASYYATKDRTYKADVGITLDTLSLHANGNEIGFRFYHKTPKAKNKRHAYFAQFLKSLDEVIEKIDQDGLDNFCDNLAEDAVREIIKEGN